MRPPLALIAAMARNRVIGMAGQLPWHRPEDLQHFKAMTLGHAVIMGRRTALALQARPLPRRRNIVLSRDPTLVLPGFELATSLEQAIAAARCTDPLPMIIGGGEVYAAALPLVTVMHLTTVDVEPAGDAVFPRFAAEDWHVRAERRSGDLLFQTLDRRGAPAPLALLDQAPASAPLAHPSER